LQIKNCYGPAFGFATSSTPQVSDTNCSVVASLPKNTYFIELLNRGRMSADFTRSPRSAAICQLLESVTGWIKAADPINSTTMTVSSPRTAGNGSSGSIPVANISASTTSRCSFLPIPLKGTADLVTDCLCGSLNISAATSAPGPTVQVRMICTAWSSLPKISRRLA